MYPVGSPLSRHAATQKSLATDNSLERLVPSLYHVRPPEAFRQSEPPTNGTVVGQYLVDLTSVLSAGAGRGRRAQCLDLTTGLASVSHIYSMKTFTWLSPLLLTSIEGVRQPLDVTVFGNDVLIVYPITHGDLHGHLKQCKRLSEVEAAGYFKQVVGILYHSHCKRVVLRDLKLKKFMFSDPSRTSLFFSDLEDAYSVKGLADGEDMLTDRHGCPAYVAPEMLQPGPYSGRAADMWSAGIILYTLLVGHYPFFDSNPRNLFTKIRSGHYHIPEHISYLARSLICSLLSYDPALRPSSEAVYNHPWLTNPPSEVEYPLRPLKSEVDQRVPAMTLIQ